MSAIFLYVPRRKYSGLGDDMGSDSEEALPSASGVCSRNLVGVFHIDICVIIEQ